MPENKEFKSLHEINDWEYKKTYLALMPGRIKVLTKKVYSLIKGKILK